MVPKTEAKPKKIAILKIQARFIWTECLRPAFKYESNTEYAQQCEVCKGLCQKNVNIIHSRLELMDPFVYVTKAKLLLGIWFISFSQHSPQTTPTPCSKDTSKTTENSP